MFGWRDFSMSIDIFFFTRKLRFPIRLVFFFFLQGFWQSTAYTEIFFVIYISFFSLLFFLFYYFILFWHLSYYPSGSGWVSCAWVCVIEMNRITHTQHTMARRTFPPSFSAPFVVTALLTHPFFFFFYFFPFRKREKQIQPEDGTIYRAVNCADRQRRLVGS